MSVAECLEHPWLADPKICPVLAPKELLPDTLSKHADSKAEESVAETGGTGDSKDLPEQYGQLHGALPGNVLHAKSGASIAQRAADAPPSSHISSAGHFIPGTSSTG